MSKLLDTLEVATTIASKEGKVDVDQDRVRIAACDAACRLIAVQCKYGDKSQVLDNVRKGN